MTSDKYVVTRKISGKTSASIWDASSPMELDHSMDWVLENTSSGIRVRDVRGALNEVRKATSIKVTPQMIAKNEEFQLADSAVSVQIRHAHSVLPPYLTLESRGAEPATQLFAYAGVRRSLISANAVHSAYVAYARAHPVFTLYRSPDGIRVKPLLDGVRLKHKGQPAISGKVGESWEIKTDELNSTTIARGWFWWRFNLVSTTPLEKRDTIDETSHDPEKVFLKKMGVGIAIALFAIAYVAWLWPSPEAPVKPEEPKPQLARLYQPKASAPSRESSDSPRESQSPSQPETPAAKQGPVQAKTPAKVSKAVEQARKVKDALAGMKSLMSKSSQNAGPAAPASAKSLFDSSGAPGLGKTGIKPVDATGSSKVSGLGGEGGKGGGYARGNHGSLRGGGGSFVSMESGDSLVEEGLSKDEVGRVIHSHLGEVRYCHEASMVVYPQIEGKLVLQFVIDATGMIRTAAIQSSTLPDRGLEQCIRKRLMTWRFPKPKGGVTVSVSYPFLFKTLERR